MSDERAQLLRMLDELHGQLADSPQIDETTRARLEATIADTRKSLSGAPQAPAMGTMRKRLHEAAIEFEASHPALGGTLTGVIDALAQMGI